MLDFNQITPYRDGKVGFIAGLAQQIGIDHIFNTALEKHSGRPSDILRIRQGDRDLSEVITYVIILLRSSVRARQRREKSSTGIYHIMVRGINRQTICEYEED